VERGEDNGDGGHRQSRWTPPQPKLTALCKNAVNGNTEQYRLRSMSAAAVMPSSSVCVCISRCSCDECNIVRLVASGIVSPELTDQLSHSCGGTPMPAPSYCFADVLPQMMMAGSGDGRLHSQLPMMFGPFTE